MSSILYVDLETTVDGGPKAESPEAHWHVNKVLVWGWSLSRGKTHTQPHHRDLYYVLKKMEKEDKPVIVAHNLKFDLKYMMREMPDVRWEKFDYWDTATMHYLWSGHRDKFPGFEWTCDQWNVAYTKTLKLDSLLQQGVKMQDIDRTDLEGYCADDVRALARLHIAQIADDWCRKQEHTNWIAPLAEMELNGMRLDPGRCKQALLKTASDAIKAEKEMQTTFLQYCKWDTGHPMDFSKISVTAPRTVSACITGKPERLTNHKTRTLQLAGFPKMSAYEIKEVWGDIAPTHLGYPMSEYYIERILALPYLDPTVRETVEHLVEYRKANKLASTYYAPFQESAKINGTVHPSMNTQSTATGRLSSSNPNGQNMPPEARAVFMVHNPNNNIFELDFKQLEIIAAQWWSEDTRLTQDLLDGEDVHFNTGKTVMGWQYETDQTEEQRRIVKGVNFGLLFGGGAEGLSKSTGQDKSMVRSLIKGFFDRYPGVEDWHEEVYTQVCDDMQPESIEKGEQRYCSWYQHPKLHRRWYFVEKPAPAWVRKRLGRSFSFKPTETKNYPVQGFAGGDIVMTYLTLFWRLIRSLQLPITLTMTVHDSIIIETSLDKKSLSTYTDKVRDHVCFIYGIKVPLKYDIKGGNTHWR